MTVSIEERSRVEPGRRRLLTLALLDAVLVAVLGLLTVLTGDSSRHRSDELILAIVVLPLLLRRRWPIPVLVVVVLGATLTSRDTATPWVQVASVAIASFTVGERASDRIRSAFVVLVLAALVAVAFVAQGEEPVESIVLPFVFLVPSWLLGDVVRSWRLEAVRRAHETERAVRAREEQLTAATAEERRHVARELHDVVAHAVSVMVIQAGAARQVLRSSPDEAEDALLAVETTGREAMAELRRFLGSLSDADEAPGLAPQPGIDALAGLMDRVREAGLPASLEIDGMVRSVPVSLEVTVFRIVQEALTNALRYAERATTLVRLTWEPDQLRLEILDDGPGDSGTARGGRGLVGMRERASLAGGHLEAGPRVGGGYAVRAWLPLEPGAVSSSGVP
jgi:signal transduction histidine kinase